MGHASWGVLVSSLGHLLLGSRSRVYFPRMIMWSIAQPISQPSKTMHSQPETSEKLSCSFYQPLPGRQKKTLSYLTHHLQLQRAAKHSFNQQATLTLPIGDLIQ